MRAFLKLEKLLGVRGPKEVVELFLGKYLDISEFSLSKGYVFCVSDGFWNSCVDWMNFSFQAKMNSIHMEADPNLPNLMKYRVEHRSEKEIAVIIHEEFLIRFAYHDDARMSNLLSDLIALLGVVHHLENVYKTFVLKHLGEISQIHSLESVDETQFVNSDLFVHNLLHLDSLKDLTKLGVATSDLTSMEPPRGHNLPPFWLCSKYSAELHQKCSSDVLTLFFPNTTPVEVITSTYSVMQHRSAFADIQPTWLTLIQHVPQKHKN